MGAVLSKNKYDRLEAKTIGETALGCYTEVSSHLRNARIDSVTDETFGSASNLLKSTEVDSDFENDGQGKNDVTDSVLNASLLKVLYRGI